MKTIIQKVDPMDLSKNSFKQAEAFLKQGELVAFPTETVYGLGGDALDDEAAKKIYAAKGRPSDNPLIVHIASCDALQELAVEVPKIAYDLADRFWPGPMTIILKKSPIVPYGTTGGLDTVAIRMPSHPVAHRLIAESNVYIAAPSANLSGRPSPTTAKHVIQDMDGRIAMIIDGGNCDIGLESTIIDLTQNKPMILRPGFITLEQMREVVPDVEYDPAVISKQMNKNIVAKAPGMKYRHYAPRGQLTIFEGQAADVIETINQQAAKKIRQGYNVGILATEETKDSYPEGMVRSIGSRKEEREIAAHLFAVLRDFDDCHTDFIFSESFEDNNLSKAIMNRLLKAAGYQIVVCGEEKEH